MAWFANAGTSPPGAWDPNLAIHDAGDSTSNANESHQRNDSANSASAAAILRTHSSSSEWKFASPWDIIKQPDSSIVLNPSPQLASLASLRESFIIYIDDGDSRLHGRVMVVLRGKRAFYSCLAMCRHNRRFEYLEDHWRVKGVSAATTRSGGAAAAGAASSEPSRAEIRVELEPQCHEATDTNNVPTRFDVLPDTTIDIWNIWSVENTVRVHVLGRVEPASMLKLKMATAEMLCVDLGVPFPPAVVTEAVSQRAPEPQRARVLHRERSNRDPDRHGHHRHRRDE